MMLANEADASRLTQYERLAYSADLSFPETQKPFT